MEEMLTKNTLGGLGIKRPLGSIQSGEGMGYMTLSLFLVQAE